VLFVLTGVAGSLTIVFTIAFPPRHAFEGVATIALCVLLIAIAAGLVAMRHPPAWLWAVYPFLSVVLLVVMDVITHDASVTAQVFFFFPVLYAGAELRRVAAVATCIAAIAGEATVALTVASGGKAGADLAFVAAALATAGVLLLHAGERNDRLIQQLERQAAVDPLTGLMTRRVLDTAVKSAIDGAGDTAGTALLLMDVDKFKTINDVHGHPAGDAVLQELAGILLGLSRPEDLVSRLGGDEIAVLLAGCPLEVAALRAQRIVDAVRTHAFDITEHTSAGHHERTCLTVTLSIGVAHLSTRGRELRSLYTAADGALYDAKRRGRDQVAVAPEAEDAEPDAKSDAEPGADLTLVPLGQSGERRTGVGR
jgi:diguanylate cyclase (GGDEF)-like protein